MDVYSHICEKQTSGQVQFAVLIDPDKAGKKELHGLLNESVIQYADVFFVGGSLLSTTNLNTTIHFLKEHTTLPVVIFPGDQMQISPEADAILFLSLISGRNAEMLIGRHVITAPYIRSSKLESIATGYMLIDGGRPTTASYMSSSMPIPWDKPDIAATTALAGEMLGLKTIYLDTGSGAKQALSTEMLRAVKETVSIPIIVGGGIRSPQEAERIAKAGADIIVVGNALEKDPSLLREIADAIHLVNTEQ